MNIDDVNLIQITLPCLEKCNQSPIIYEKNFNRGKLTEQVLVANMGYLQQQDPEKSNKFIFN